MNTEEAEGSDVQQHTFCGATYDCQRVTDRQGLGYIDMRQPGTGAVLARIDYHGPDRPMEVTTHGRPLPLPALQWLLERAEWGLA